MKYCYFSSPCWPLKAAYSPSEPTHTGTSEASGVPDGAAVGYLCMFCGVSGPKQYRFLHPVKTVKAKSHGLLTGTKHCCGFAEDVSDDR